MHLKFAQQLLLVLLIIVSFALLTAGMAGWQAAVDNVSRNARADLDIAQRVFERQLAENYEQLSDRATVLSSDFGFRTAIATGDEETIISVLANHGERIEADMIFALTRDAHIIASSHDLSNPAAMIGAVGNDEKDTLILSEGSLFQVVVMPVFAPDLVAWAGIGFKVDQGFSERLAGLVLTDVTLLQSSQDSANVKVMSSTLKPEWLQTLAREYAPFTRPVLERFLTSHDTAIKTFEILNDDGLVVTALLSSSLAEALRAFDPLKTQMLLILVICLVAALVMAAVFARMLSNPINKLVQATERIGEGNYHEPVMLKTRNELGKLAVAFNGMQSQIEEREEMIRLQANFDMLTRLPNRLHFAELISSTRPGKKYSGSNRFGILLIHIFNLQQLTDAYGGAWADLLLPMIAERLMTLQRRGDHVGRVGGDKFAMYCDELDVEGIETITDKINNSLSHSFVVEGIEIKVDMRIGVVLSPSHGEEFVDLLRRAHIALHKLSGSGKNVAVYEAGQDEQHRRQIQLTNKLQTAVNKDEGLFLTFQPKLDLKLTKVTQAEALIRWNDAELGMIFPDEFIPLAENSGLILSLTEWVLVTAVKQVRVWREKGIDVAVGVNLSAHDFLQPGFVNLVQDVVRKNGAKPSDLILEVTESATMFDMERAIAYMTQFRELGYQVSMDDFGTGYSSLSQLKQLPLNELKIDKSFLQHVDTDEDDRKIVESTINLAHNLGLSVVAEGIESKASLDLLRAMKCDKIQGYFLSRPMKADDFTDWYQSFDKEQFL